MSPKIRSVLIVIGLLTLIVIGIIVIPRGLSLYYQTRGGQYVEYVLRSTEGIQELVCDELPPSDEEGRDEVEQAIIDLDRAVRFNRNNSQAYYYLGKSNCLLGYPSDAKENYSQYTGLRPANPLGYIGLGFANEELGDTSAARVAWKSADLNASDLNQAGDDLFKADQYEEAILWYQRALLVEPKSAESWLNIGMAYDALKDYESALKAYMKAWEKNPELSTAALVKSYKRNGDLNSVKDVLQQMLERFPNSSDRLLWFQELGSSHLSHGDYDQAVELFTEAIGEFPYHPDLHISLGWAFYELGNAIDNAQIEFDRAIELNENSGEGYFAKAKLFSLENRYKEADEYFLEAIERSPNNKWYLLARAENARLAGDNSKAIDLYLDIIILYPDFPNAYYQLAQAYKLAGIYPQAMETIEQALRLKDPPLSSFYTLAGEIYRGAGIKGKAVSYYHQALALNPNNEKAENGLRLLEED